MAISARARGQLAAFADEAAVAAALSAEPWRHAELLASQPSAVAGTTVSVRWNSPAERVPTFVRMGHDRPWEPVAAQGQRLIQVGVEDVHVALRVGPHIARELTITAQISGATLTLFPAANFCVPFGDVAIVEWYASLSKRTRMRRNHGPWQDVSSMGGIELREVLSRNTVEVEVSGWDGIALRKVLEIAPTPTKSSARTKVEDQVRQTAQSAYQAWRIPQSS